MRSAKRVRREAEEASNGEPKETGNVEIVNEAEVASHKEIETLDNEKQVNQEVIAEIAVDKTNTTEDEPLQETADSDDNMIVATPIGAVEPVHDMLPDNPPVIVKDIPEEVEHEAADVIPIHIANQKVQNTDSFLLVECYQSRLCWFPSLCSVLQNLSHLPAAQA